MSKIEPATLEAATDLLRCLKRGYPEIASTIRVLLETNGLTLRALGLNQRKLRALVRAAHRTRARGKLRKIRKKFCAATYESMLDDLKASRGRQSDIGIDDAEAETLVRRWRLALATNLLRILRKNPSRRCAGYIRRDLRRAHASPEDIGTSWQEINALTANCHE